MAWNRQNQVEVGVWTGRSLRRPHFILYGNDKRDKKAIPPPPRFQHVSLFLPWQLPLQWDRGEGESNKLMGVIRNCSLGGDSSKHIAIACHKRKGPLLSSSRDIYFACISHLYSSSISAPLHIYCRDTMSVSGLKIICHSWRSFP